ncbi:RNA methylase [Pyrolobus fumarii 1A]|uniref:tRNA (guanine(10)-N(2))-dimethyltransferase n=1 Tax=Pyrolobus fumarii (strain DSM 11204 / 1A) TaxID=694429 RepID=G0ECS7_PYRF1|nr:RsmD family RNA methyltransferase [Pyrolobus fumarii]AEM39647.1 RNA methylase [Pyrolobus fumarii 1A]
MERFYAVLAGSHATLPLAELRGILDVEARRYGVLAVHTQLVLFEAEGLDAQVVTRRAGFVEEVGRLLAYTEAEPGAVEAVLETLEPLPGVYRVEFRRLRGFAASLYPDERAALKRFVGILESRGWKLSPRSYTGIIRIIVEEGVAVAGVMLGKLRVSELRDRWPHLRPFYKPGALDPRMARLFVNLARVARGSRYLDPFCGTGGFAIEALLSAGAREAICGDIDRDMAAGSAVNLSRYTGGRLWVTARWDARRLPLRDESVDSIGTDTPYGRLTTTAGMKTEVIVAGFLREAARVLRRGGFVAFACPHWVECRELTLDAGLQLLEEHYMRVHGSLTRIIIIARRR